ncbi:penicillin-binding protein transpeptidase [Catenulispora acidiphila DSM 44928]|uniref:Penicillin-binding protein transpeptidase n=1 Tax=Catenulispora acidiphila (strain DSM 44928 / JCM 14897 / NBRC 102108 / NRRL B-24433 / ID139908) TaxID=479433 RepID=C7Q8V6_CATAD|nr:penicillin-binding transpeptidase domain-containing protein [Catenulispora acidiphila]ACU70371.1 penicillin-binding protein transpeptidase [Catenulispora acidiphila DSM 44928]
MAGKQRRGRRSTRTVATAVVTVAVVAAASAALWLRSDHHGTSPTAQTGPDSAAAAGSGSNPAANAAPTTPEAVAKDFLAAWASGDYTKAGSLTDNASAAGPRLQAVMKSLNPKSTQLTLGSQIPATGATPDSATRYNVNVVDSFDGGLQWTYTSILAVVPASGAASTPLVHWSSAVIHPQLGAQANLTATPPPAAVVDDTGLPLQASAHPSLGTVLTRLATAKSPEAPASNALQVNFVDANTGVTLGGTAPIVLGTATIGTASQITSTLDVRVQTAAEHALTAYPNSGMVVIKPSTGGVLAMASNSQSTAGLAYHAIRAPGSTFKTITTAALLQTGLTPSDAAPCPPTSTVGSQTYHNDEGLKNGYPNATLTDAFEQSCNTSYVGLRNRLSGLGALENEAKTQFGLNQPWDMGLGSATYCTAGSEQVPAADGQERFAAETFGQGDITMCPLTMASVAATVANGTFKQPILLPGQSQVAATPLPAGVDKNLKTLMRGVITEGTATSLRGISSTLGAKTGTAERQNEDPDSWMIAMDPQHDIAVACVVLNGGFGNDKAGPAIKAMLTGIGIG